MFSTKKLLISVGVYSLLILLTACQSNPQRGIKKVIPFQRFEVADIEIIYQPTESNVIGLTWLFKGGGAKNEIESLVVRSALECGTEYYFPDVVRAKFEGFGTQVSCSTGVDASFISMLSLEKYFYSSFELLSEVLLHPIFQKECYQNLRENFASEAITASQHPIHRIIFPAYSNHYATYKRNPMPGGQYDSILNYTATRAQKYYYQNILKRNSMCLVVVGKIDILWLLEQIRQVYSNLPAGNRQEAPTQIQLSSNIKVFKDTTNYATLTICGISKAPRKGSIEYIGLETMLLYIERHLRYELCTKRKLSCELSFSILPTADHSIVFLLATDYPAATLPVLQRYWADLKNFQWTENDIEPIRATLLRRYYENQQSPRTQSINLAEASVYHSLNNLHQYPTTLKRLRALELNPIFQKYCKDWSWYYISPPAHKKILLDTLRLW